jgi:hypothetical protein
MDEKPIFRTTSQALHFAYIMDAYESSVESVMAKAIRHRMKESGIWDTGVPSTVDFGGLNALEVRGQCAMIRAAVNSRLPRHEAWAVQATYGICDTIKEGEKEILVFTNERQGAIRKLSKWMVPSLRDLNSRAVYTLVGRAVDRRCSVTLREMSGKYGLSQSTLFRSLNDVRHRIDTLVDMAIGRLTPVFIVDGLVES